MIDSIEISSYGSYSDTLQRMNELKKFNFVFGANSTGKTTIAKIIADPQSFSKCSVNWIDRRPLQALVYNRDFVERNFNRQNPLKGIFTLGQKNIDTEAKIETAKKELNDLADRETQLANTLDSPDGTEGKKAELRLIESEFQEACWDQKRKHEADFRQAFEGYLKKSRSGTKYSMKLQLIGAISNRSTISEPALFSLKIQPPCRH